VYRVAGLSFDMQIISVCAMICVALMRRLGKIWLSYFDTCKATHTREIRICTPLARLSAGGEYQDLCACAAIACALAIIIPSRSPPPAAPAAATASPLGGHTVNSAPLYDRKKQGGDEQFVRRSCIKILVYAF